MLVDHQQEVPLRGKDEKGLSQGVDPVPSVVASFSELLKPKCRPCTDAYERTLPNGPTTLVSANTTHKDSGNADSGGWTYSPDGTMSRIYAAKMFRVAFGSAGEDYWNIRFDLLNGANRIHSIQKRHVRVRYY